MRWPENEIRVGEFSVSFRRLPPLNSLFTLRFDASNGYKLEEEEEMKILVQVSWPEVAGSKRKRPAKVVATVRSGREKEDAGERRESRVSRNGNPKSQKCYL